MNKVRFAKSPEMGFSEASEKQAQQNNKELAQQLKAAADAMREAQKAGKK